MELPGLLLPDSLPSQMEPGERLVLGALCAQRRPACAIEIGTAGGASLQLLAAHAGVVHSIDIDARVKETLAPRFPNAVFHTGDSRVVLPQLLRTLDAQGTAVGLVLIDADHSTHGVRDDIEAVLLHTPTEPLYLIMHDSFHPACREGIRTAAWHANTHVHAVELDLVAGMLHTRAGVRGELWGGLAFALLLPEARMGPLAITASGEALFRAARLHPSHLRATAALAIKRLFRRW